MKEKIYPETPGEYRQILESALPKITPNTRNRLKIAKSAPDTKSRQKITETTHPNVSSH